MYQLQSCCVLCSKPVNEASPMTAPNKPITKSAFTQGWNTAEGGGIPLDNPFEQGSVKYEQFFSGYNAHIRYAIIPEKDKLKSAPKRKRKL